MSTGVAESRLVEGGDADAALHAFLHQEGATLVGTIAQTHGYASVGTARKGRRIYAIQAFWESEEG